MAPAPLPVLVIDFDSTIVRVESLDLLAVASFAERTDGTAKAAEIAEITRLGMEGKIDFRESLTRRIAMLDCTRAQVDEVARKLTGLVSPSFAAHRDQLRECRDRIYVITGGFRDLALPTITSLGLREDHLFANDFTYGADGQVTGFDEQNPLCQAGGKVVVVNGIPTDARKLMVGDGYTDYQVRERGAADKFYYFAEVVKRSPVMPLADKVVYGIDEVLAELDLPTRYSFPRSKLQVLLLDDIDPLAATALKDQGYRVEVVNDRLDEEQLMRMLPEVAVLGVRTRTKLPARVLAAGSKLQAVGVFAVGLDHVDIVFAASRGVAVFNAPYSNTRSVVELALGQIIMLLRRVPEHSWNMHAGQWVKSASNQFEVRGKKLGIIGYGNIGSQLSVLAEACGMDVLYYDLAEKLALGKAQKTASMNELLSQADVVTVHCDGRPGNQKLIGAREFGLMKDGVVFLNLSRGNVVDIDALRQAIKDGKVAGAGVDVFPVEPKSAQESFDTPLRGLSNVILSPHIGGSTEEAQRNIATFVSAALGRFLASGETSGCVSLPELVLPPLSRGMRVLHVHANMPGLVARVAAVLAAHGVNIVGQNLATRDQVGYLVTDLGSRVEDEVLAELRAVPETIKVRAVYP